MGKLWLPDSAVLAFGGNALIGPDDTPESKTVEAQERAMFEAAKVIVDIRNYISKLLVVHGNGPQAGWMMDRVRLALKYGMHDVPLANIVANSQGSIGMGMAKQIANANPNLINKITQIGTQVLVDSKGDAFKKPSKPIGDFMTEEEARIREREDGWTVKKFNDKKREKPFRRVVLSPEPTGIVEIDTIRANFENEIITICCGGGGIASTLENGKLEWIDAVIDKDKAAALVAIMLEIKLLAIFTAEDGIYLPDDFRKKHNGDNAKKPIPQISTKELKEMLPDLPSGSMKPKAEALIKFAQETQNQAWIGPLKNGNKALIEGKGTTIVPS